MRWGRSTGVSTGSNATFSSPATALPTLAALRSSSLARATSDRSSGSSAVPAAVSVTPRALTRCSNRTHQTGRAEQPGADAGMLGGFDEFLLRQPHFIAHQARRL